MSWAAVGTDYRSAYVPVGFMCQEFYQRRGNTGRSTESFRMACASGLLPCH